MEKRIITKESESLDMGWSREQQTAIVLLASLRGLPEKGNRGAAFIEKINEICFRKMEGREYHETGFQTDLKVQYTPRGLMIQLEKILREKGLW